MRRVLSLVLTIVVLKVFFPELAGALTELIATIVAMSLTSLDLVQSGLPTP